MISKISSILLKYSNKTKKLLFCMIPFVFALLFACSSTFCNYFETLQSAVVSPVTVLFSNTGFEVFKYFMKCLSIVSLLGSICLLLLFLPLKVIKDNMIKNKVPEVAFTFCLLLFYILILLSFVYLAGVFIINTPSFEPILFHH